MESVNIQHVIVRNSEIVKNKLSCTSPKNAELLMNRLMSGYEKNL